VNSCIVHDDNRPTSRPGITQRQQIFRYESFECLRVHASLINLTDNISINSHRRQHTEVLSLCGRHLIAHHLAFFAPATSSLSRFRIDARFVKKNKLFSSPSSGFYDPMRSQLWITFSGFLLKLTLAHNVEESAFLCVKPCEVKKALSCPFVTVISNTSFSLCAYSFKCASGTL